MLSLAAVKNWVISKQKKLTENSSPLPCGAPGGSCGTTPCRVVADLSAHSDTSVNSPTWPTTDDHRVFHIPLRRSSVRYDWDVNLHRPAAPPRSTIESLCQRCFYQKWDLGNPTHGTRCVLLTSRLNPTCAATGKKRFAYTRVNFATSILDAGRGAHYGHTCLGSKVTCDRVRVTPDIRISHPDQKSARSIRPVTLAFIVCTADDNVVRAACGRPVCLSPFESQNYETES